MISLNLTAQEDRGIFGRHQHRAARTIGRNSRLDRRKIRELPIHLAREGAPRGGSRMLRGGGGTEITNDN